MENSSSQLKDWPALGVVKFVCLAALILVHAHMALIMDGNVIVSTQSFYFKATSAFMFIGFFLMILPVLAGAILRMDLGEGLVAGKIKSYDFKKTAWVAVWLALTGFFMNAAVWGWRAFFAWNVLQLIALSFLTIVFLLKRFSVRTVFWFGLFSLLAAAPLRDFLGGWSHIYLVGIFVGVNNFLVVWPFFPWFGVVVFGFLVAHCYLEFKNNVKFRVGLSALGVGLLAAAIFQGELAPRLNPDSVWGSSIFQPALGGVLAVLGFFCLLAALADVFFNRIHLRKYGIINCYSKGILWIYVAQMFASQKLAPLIKKFFPMNEPSLAYFILPVFMIFFGWLIGALSIKFLQEKLIVIRLKKVQ